MKALSKIRTLKPGFHRNTKYKINLILLLLSSMRFSQVDKKTVEQGL